MEELLELIRQFEGLRLESYKCSAGVWTIGYGHTQGVKKGQKCTMQEAENWLLEEVTEFRERVAEIVPTSLGYEQINALTSFAYNVGIEALKTSTLLNIIREDENDLRIVHQFSRWKKAGGVVVVGLLRRRRKECELYFKNYQNKTHLRNAIKKYFDSVI